MIQNLIDKGLKVRFLEHGAGLATSSKIFQVSGASKVVYSAESYYDRVSFKDKFGEIPFRTVSAQAVKHIIDNTIIDKYDILFVSSFQIGSDISSHGWIGIRTKEKIRYYHVSLDGSTFLREYNISKIGHIGVEILYNNIIDNTRIINNVNMILDENLNDLLEETIDNLTSICTIDNGKLIRIEDITRTTHDMVLYKGSFNPPTIAHMELLEKSKDDNTKAAFVISKNTIGKGNQNTKSLIERISKINKLGYPVIISQVPNFRGTVNYFYYMVKGTIIFPIGTDTINRLAEDYKGFLFDKESFRDHFERCRFVVGLRDGVKVNKNMKKFSNVQFVQLENSHVSSTAIRENNKSEFLPSGLKENKFSNVPNKLVKSEDGKEYWISRSVAVVSIVNVLCKGINYYLINKRGKGTPDCQGMWNLPAGYLDYNETAYHAAMREVYEECGVYLPDYKIENDFTKVWMVRSSPDTNRQNVTLYHIFQFNVESLPLTTKENNEKDEVEEILWITHEQIKDFDFCFKHDIMLNTYCDEKP